mmetsp:Transcript_64118/g.171629  ORF Transcript_64118/g.171629 Transcript_64118/m.171629 type:complete len:81 (+) Transcript_64118:1555-1797(+)
MSAAARNSDLEKSEDLEFLGLPQAISSGATSGLSAAARAEELAWLEATNRPSPEQAVVAVYRPALQQHHPSPAMGQCAGS